MTMIQTDIEATQEVGNSKISGISCREMMSVFHNPVRTVDFLFPGKKRESCWFQEFRHHSTPV